MVVSASRVVSVIQKPDAAPCTRAGALRSPGCRPGVSFWDVARRASQRCGGEGGGELKSPAAGMSTPQRKAQQQLEDCTGLKSFRQDTFKSFLLEDEEQPTRSANGAAAQPPLAPFSPTHFDCYRYMGRPHRLPPLRITPQVPRLMGSPAVRGGACSCGTRLHAARHAHTRAAANSEARSSLLRALRLGAMRGAARELAAAAMAA